MQPDRVNRPTPQQEAIIAAVPKEAFKAMFYLFAGKPDSKVKLFHRPISISPDDIQDLNQKVNDKLRLHLIDQVVASATVKFDKEECIEFGTWVELKSFDWKTAYVTNEVALRWDFLVKLPAYAAPQRHTLTVRISTSPRPRDFLQMVLSRDPDDDSDISGKMALCVARVDFISHRLADELIDVIEGWNESLRQPVAACGWFASFEKWDVWIARAVHFSVPVFMAALAIAIIRMLLPAQAGPVTPETLRLASEWILLSVLGLYIFTRLSGFLAQRCYRAVNEYGTFAPFLLTRGDENRLQKFAAKNRRQMLLFWLSAGFAVFLNVLAGVITWWLLPKP